jgi:ABC-type phosphate transport system, permease component
MFVFLLGYMIIPTVHSKFDDAFNAVSNSLRNWSIALGATRSITSPKNKFPAALSGIIALFYIRFFLGL